MRSNSGFPVQTIFGSHHSVCAGMRFILFSFKIMLLDTDTMLLRYYCYFFISLLYIYCKWHEGFSAEVWIRVCTFLCHYIIQISWCGVLIWSQWYTIWPDLLILLLYSHEMLWFVCWLLLRYHILSCKKENDFSKILFFMHVTNFGLIFTSFCAFRQFSNETIDKQRNLWWIFKFLFTVCLSHFT